ncbi:IclR family transcriptional regulator C-terminal domain-containing protein [Psychrobacter sp. SIMBA_152]
MNKSQEQKISTDSSDFIASLAAGLDIMLVFDKNHSSMTLSEVAERANIDRAKARRYLLTLHALGYVHKNKRQFSLTPRTLSFGVSYLNSTHHNEIIQFYLERVTEETGESCSFAVLEGNDVVYIARSAAEHRLTSIILSIGTRLPAVYTSMGRAILANLPDEELKNYVKNAQLNAHTQYSIIDSENLQNILLGVKAKQYAIVDQELENGLRSLAVPVYKSNNELIGAINISVNAMRVSNEVLTEQFLPILHECAANIRTYYI